MSRRISRKSVYTLALLGIFSLTACATIHVATIPPPTPSAKLRVYVQPFTGYGNWIVPHEEFVAGSVRLAERYLNETGIYEVVGKQDIRAVLNNQNISRRQFEQDNWALAKKIGKALHADYVMIIERNLGNISGGSDFTIDNIMINSKTGKKYVSSYHLAQLTRSDRERTAELIRATYRDIFLSAKQDMLATAIKKSSRLPQQTRTVPVISQSTAQQPPAAPQKSARVSEPKKTKPPASVREQKQEVAASLQHPAAQKSSEREWIQEPAAEAPLAKRYDPVKGTKLVVFDLEASENYKPAALILTEALRQELFLLKKFVLINRENLQLVLQETALQQTGLIDEKQAVKTGKGLAANQVITGNLGLLGKTFVLQAKRIDVETFTTLGLASTKFKEGQEDAVLSKMSDLAKILAGMQ